MNFKFSRQAQLLITSLKIFNKDDFLKWYEDNNIYITYNDILEFLMIYNSPSRLEMIKKLKDVGISDKLIFSEELKNIKDNLEIDIDLLKKFFIKKIEIIGDRDILIYFNNIKKEEVK